MEIWEPAQGGTALGVDGRLGEMLMYSAISPLKCGTNGVTGSHTSRGKVVFHVWHVSPLRRCAKF